MAVAIRSAAVTVGISTQGAGATGSRGARRGLRGQRQALTRDQQAFEVVAAPGVGAARGMPKVKRLVGCGIGNGGDEQGQEIGEFVHEAAAEEEIPRYATVEATPMLPSGPADR